MTAFPITPRMVRYVKLGNGGAWEQDCRNKGILRFGYETGDADTIAMCREGRWSDLALAWQSARKTKARGTMDAKEIRIYWTDPGDILWVTFIGDDLCWGFLEPGEPVPYASADDEESSYRMIKGGWQSTDKDGKRLGKSNLPGFITKVASYRGTSCSIERDDRLVARINGIRTPDVERVVDAKAELQGGLATLVRHLGPQDFEVLVDMMFARAGWRRVGHIGGTTRDKDLDLEMPLTEERAFVQIKTWTNPADLQHYVARFVDMPAYRRLFFVYHSSDAKIATVDDPRVSVMDAFAVAGRVIEAGLVDWLVNRVY